MRKNEENDLSAESLGRLVSITPETIQEEYINFPPTMVTWGMKLVAARRAARVADLERKVGERRLAIAKRAEAERAEKKTTEGAIEAAVVGDPEYQRLAEAVIDAQVLVDTLGEVYQALRDKKEMLISLGADLRVEKEADPTLRSRQR